MGKEKYLKDIEALFKKSPVVEASSISRLVKNKKKVKQYNKQLIRNLILKNKIKKITKGYYSFSDDPSLAVFCFDGYLGLQNALSIHNLWEQETIPIIITPKKVRQGIRKVSDSNILIRRLNKKYFFGISYINYGNFYLPVSDIEKTFIDMVYFNEKINKETQREFNRKIDWKKLTKYTKMYPKNTRKKILAYKNL